ncbi:MAG: LPS export ABC transporter periplasmic protein LptC [Casimicrobium sp.]
MSTFTWRRRQDRLAALFPVIAIALFALLTFWLDARVSESARAQQKSSQPAPDWFLQNFKIERTAADGRVESTMTGDRATHFPRNETTVVDRPRFESQPEGKPKMDVDATRAILKTVDEKSGIDQVDFSGKVVARQGPTPGREAVTYESDTLTVFPKTQRAQTDAVTRTISGDRVMTTQGLRVDGEKKQGQTTRGIEIELSPKDVGAVTPSKEKP